MDDVAAFLRQHPPFDSLGDEELARVSASVETRTYDPGTDVLVEDGPVARHFYVPHEGTVELLHEDEVVDVLEPGEGFGHMSLLTGLAPGFTVRAREPLTCYLVPGDEARRVLGRLSGAGFVASSIRHRLVRAGHTVHALSTSLETVPVSELVRSRPVSVAPGTPIREVAAAMTSSGRSAALVLSEPLLIVTDAHLRAKVVVGGVGLDEPVERVAERAVIVDPARLAVEAVVDMLEGDRAHLVVADGRNVLGILSAGNLLGVQGRSPLALRRAVLDAADDEELERIARQLGTLFLALLDAGVSPVGIGRVLTLQQDAFTTRLLDFARARHGEAPVAWAWLALGSGARRELTISSDQEHALAYGGKADPTVDAYFERVARDVVDGLVRCGFAVDPNSVLASASLWRMSLTDWERTLADCFAEPDRSHLIRATVAFDFREVAGALDATPPLVSVLRQARRHPDFVRRLARTATDFKPPLGFRHAFRTDGVGGQRGTIDVKRGGMLPIVNIARFHALSSEVTISATLDRLVAVEELGRLPAHEATALREAFEIVWRVRLEHHAAGLRARGAVDDDVDPRTLRPLEREELREAFRAIRQAQRRLAVYVPLGI